MWSRACPSPVCGSGTLGTDNEVVRAGQQERLACAFHAGWASLTPGQSADCQGGRQLGPGWTWTQLPCFSLPESQPRGCLAGSTRQHAGTFGEGPLGQRTEEAPRRPGLKGGLGSLRGGLEGSWIKEKIRSHRKWSSPSQRQATWSHSSQAVQPEHMSCGREPVGLR